MVNWSLLASHGVGPIRAGSPYDHIAYLLFDCILANKKICCHLYVKKVLLNPVQAVQ